MSCPSSIDRLPADVSASLEAWLSNPDVTQCEATRRTNALLEKLDLGELRLSRYAVHRRAQRMRRACEQALQTRQIAKEWSAKFGAAPGGHFGHFVIEIPRSLASDSTSRLRNLEIGEKALPGVVAIAYKISLMEESLERSRETALRCDREIKRQAAEEAAARTKKTKRAAIKPKRLRQMIRESYGV